MKMTFDNTYEECDDYQHAWLIVRLRLELTKMEFSHNTKIDFSRND